MKKILVAGALGLAVMASLFAGCTDGGISQGDIEQLVTDVLTANAEVGTCKFDMDMLATIEMVGGTNPGKATMMGTGNGIVDSANKEMHISMDMSVDIPDKGKQEMTMENYLVGGWAYIKMSLPVVGDKWMKMKMPEEMWGTQSQLDQQMEMLKTAKKVNFLGGEDVNGTACYVVEIVPSLEVLNKMMSQLNMPAMGDIDIGKLDLTDLIKEMSIKEWIAKDTYLFVKTENHMLIEILPGNVGAAEEDFEKITENIDIQMKFYDYNKAVSINLPEEALKAQ